MNLNQIVVNLRMKNLSQTAQIFSMELNILDSAYLKLVRDSGADDQIKIPFTLESNSENEAEYLFYLSDCTFAQKLKGTLTYMLMV